MGAPKTTGATALQGRLTARKSFLGRMGALAGLPLLLSLPSTPIAQGVEQEAYQFAKTGEAWELMEVGERVPGRATVELVGEAVRDGWNYVWQFVYRNGVREVHGTSIGR